MCMQWLVVTLFIFFPISLHSLLLLTQFRFVSHLPCTSCAYLYVRIKRVCTHTYKGRQPVTWNKWGFCLRFGTFHMHLTYGIMLFYIPRTRFLAQSTCNHIPHHSGANLFNKQINVGNRNRYAHWSLHYAQTGNNLYQNSSTFILTCGCRALLLELKTYVAVQRVIFYAVRFNKSSSKFYK